MSTPNFLKKVVSLLLTLQELEVGNGKNLSASCVSSVQTKNLIFILLLCDRDFNPYFLPIFNFKTVAIR